MILTGRVHLLGDDVNTDELHPSQYFSLDPSRRAEGALAVCGGRDRVGEGSIILVGGWNLGIGSSRESTVRGLVEAGVTAVLARSMARIFLRNAVNAGLAVGLREAGFDAVRPNEVLRLDLAAERLLREDGTQLPLDPLDGHLRAVLAAGGLVPFLTKGTRGGPRG